MNVLRLLPLLVGFTLAACQPEGQAPTGPQSPAQQKPLAYNDGGAYLIWKSRDGSAVDPLWFCASGVRFTESGCGRRNSPWVEVGGAKGNVLTLKLPDGGAIHLAEFSSSGDFFPAYAGTAGGVPKADFKAPVFKVGLTNTTYAGTYRGKAGLFRSGDWDPVGLRADLQSIGREDIAKALRTDLPDALTMKCSKKQCVFGSVERRYQGYQVLSQ